MKEPDNRQVLCRIELAFCGKISGLPFFCVAGYRSRLSWKFAPFCCTARAFLNVFLAEFYQETRCVRIELFASLAKRELV